MKSSFREQIRRGRLGWHCLHRSVGMAVDEVELPAIAIVNQKNYENRYHCSDGPAAVKINMLDLIDRWCVHGIEITELYNEYV